ncbi:cytochrome c3 family protein [Dethiobacter alkaliphilus]|uniref:cytochrome c3 family protein n=1 Tax=Dethiobacter alkaliphilus TaxID=427926 RepID=UPI002226E29C|nr:cytochrome c3 family protein [Dethiobacter alkaliphilus]MCW3488853.1 multiheme c-type cytochrome [Dethiobacter alkaliphilus]
MRKSWLLFFCMAILVVALAAGCGNNNNNNVGDNNNENNDNDNGEEVAELTYVGSESCSGCHSGEHAGWLETEHPYMIQDASEMWDVSRAALEAELEKGEGSEFTTIGGDRGRIESLDEIVYIVGQRWKQRFVVKTDEGYGFLTTQYYPEGADGAGLYGYGGGSIYEDRCLACHATGFDLEASQTVDRTAADYRLEDLAVELGVGCEACHGPASEHVASPSKDNIVNIRNLSVAQQNDFCGTCHARNSGTVGYDGRQDPIGYEFGDDLRDVTLPQSVVTGENIWRKVEGGETVGYFDSAEDGSMRFFADGAGRSHRMQYNDFEQTAMFDSKSCIDCHDLHSANGLVGDSFDDTCAQCHGDETFDIDELMPYRAFSSNTPDMRVHTFLPGGEGNPNDDVIPLTDDSEE